MKKNRKGFTVLELVIVITVIAILTAIMIPTFSGMINNSQIKKDKLLISSLNVSLAMDDKSHPTLRSALDIVNENGYNLDSIKAANSSNKILWDSKNGIFCYLNSDGEIEYITDNSTHIKYKRNTSSASYDKNKVNMIDYWVISNSVHDIYSTYYTGEDINGNLEITKGFDAGTANVKSITYISSYNQDVVICTNGGSLTIDAPYSTIDHYGDTTDVNIIKCDTESYTEYGVVSGIINIAQGHLVVTNAEFVNAVNLTAKTVELDSIIKIDIKGIISDITNYITKSQGVTLAESVSINFNNDTEITNNDADFYFYIKDSEECYIHTLNNNFNSYEECLAYYEDAGKTELLSDWTIFNPTCTENGSKNIYCTECGHLIYTEELPALGHDLIHHDAVEATCTTPGHNAYDTCSRCDYTTYQVTSSMSHNWGEVIYTWNGDECTATRICQNDNSHVESETVTAVYNQTVPATCVTASQGILVANFAKAAFLTQSKAKIGDSPLGHDVIHHNALSATCTEAGHNAYDTCSRCDYTTYQEISALGHSLVHHDALSATCTEAGHNAYDSCSRCDYSTEIVTPAIGHNFVYSHIAWNEYTAKAVFVCSNNANHTEEHNCTVTSEITATPTCATTGLKIYTATYDNHNDTKQEILPEDFDVFDASCHSFYEYTQVNTAASNYLSNVTYDPSTTTSQFNTYNVATDYNKDQPFGYTVNLVAGELTVTDNGTGNSYTTTVSAGNYTFYNLTPGVGGEFVVKNNNGVSIQHGHLRPSGTLRMIYTDTLSNVRDLGGWTCDGGTIKYNLLIRGSTPLNASENDKNTWVKLLGIEHDLFVNTQSGYPSNYSPLDNNIDLLNVTLSTLANENVIETIESAKTTGKMAQIMNYIFDNVIAGETTYIHCLNGADRTGLVTLIIEAILGVSQSDIEKDYELSCFANNDTYRASLRTYISAINSTYEGRNFRNKCANYLVDCGISLERINAFRNAMINGNASNITEFDLVPITNIPVNFIDAFRYPMEVGAAQIYYSNGITENGPYTTSNIIKAVCGEEYTVGILNTYPDANKPFGVTLFFYSSVTNTITEKFDVGWLYKGTSQTVTPVNPASDRLFISIIRSGTNENELNTYLYLKGPSYVQQAVLSDLDSAVLQYASNNGVGNGINDGFKYATMYSTEIKEISNHKVIRLSLSADAPATCRVRVNFANSDGTIIESYAINLYAGRTIDFEGFSDDIAYFRVASMDENYYIYSNPELFNIQVEN